MGASLLGAEMMTFLAPPWHPMGKKDKLSSGWMYHAKILFLNIIYHLKNMIEFINLQLQTGEAGKWLGRVSKEIGCSSTTLVVLHIEMTNI